MRRTSRAGAAIRGTATNRCNATGEDAFLAKDFRAAVKNYTDANALGEELLARAVQTVDGALAAAAAAFTAGNVELALRQYDIVLGIDPEHAAAKAGRARAERLPEVLVLVGRADDQRAHGELQQASRVIARRSRSTRAGSRRAPPLPKSRRTSGQRVRAAYVGGCECAGG